MTNTPSPTDEDRELIERLKLHAKRSSEVSRMMAQSKSLRQAHDPPRDDLYMWSEPEQTIEWKAADRLESLLSDRAKLEGDWFDKAIRDHADEHGPSGGAWNISMVLERLHRAKPVLNRSTDRAT